MNVARMPREAEERLSQVLDAAIDKIQSGVTADPSEAIAKAASELPVPAGHIPLLVRAYNTSRTTEQRKSGSSPAERAADFPIADADAVLNRLYPSNVKTAMVQSRRDGVSPEYSAGPAWYRGEREAMDTAAQRAASTERVAALEKAAELRHPLPKNDWRKSSSAPRVTYDEVQQAERQAGNLLSTAVAVQDKLNATLHKIAEALRTSGAPHIDDIRNDVEDRWGVPGRAILNCVTARNPGLLKRAAEYRPWGPTPWEKSPYREIGQAVALVDRAREAIEAHEKQATHHATLKRRILGLEPDSELRFMPVMTGGQVKLAWGQFGTALGVGLARDVAGNIGTSLAGTMTPPGGADAANSAYGKIGDPDHEEELRNISARANLAQLMADDDVVGAHHPHEVVQAFNDVSQAAPRLASQPLLLEGLLRRRLEQGAFEPFEGAQVVQTEHQLRRIGTPAGDKGQK